MGDQEPNWLIEESARPLGADLEMLAAQAPPGPRVRGASRGKPAANLAVRITKMAIQNNKRWFGGAKIRVDALVTHGHGSGSDPASWYSPGTFRFDGVRDGQPLPIFEPGLLVYYGQPRYFLDVSITVSRDREDSDDLATLLDKQAQSPEFRSALAKLATLAAMPAAGLVLEGLDSARALAAFAYRAVAWATGSTIGVYHSSFLESRDSFGLGRDLEYTVNDLTFAYEILRDAPRTG